ncbi:hypothetical protein J6590_096747 [Homalodisca vitripennis]|nr:hypothetical protein J6590_096747 [Homalodisca vitripennis]
MPSSQASRGQMGDEAAWLSDNRPPRHAPYRWTPPQPLSCRPWLPRAPPLDEDPTALNDPEVTLTDPSPLHQTAGDGPRRHNTIIFTPSPLHALTHDSHNLITVISDDTWHDG